mmetsp:Transcript_42595/g.113949  ORF Transcript_42595/g.113949 Transcript_42595/m.113949 type:complete len:250 (+) Transcript_42595:34-783(+)
MLLTGQPMAKRQRRMNDEVQNENQYVWNGGKGADSDGDGPSIATSSGGAPSPPQPRGGTSLSPRHATGCGSGSRAADNSAKTVKATEDDGVNIAVTLLTLLASVPATVPKMEPTPSVDHNCSLGGDAPREQPTKPVSDHPLVSGLPLGHDAYDHRHHLYGRHSEKALTHPHPHCYDRSGVLEHHHSSWSDPSVHHHHHRHAQTHAHHAHPQPRVHLNPYQQTSHGFQAQPYHPEWYVRARGHRMRKRCP